MLKSFRFSSILIKILFASPFSPSCSIYIQLLGENGDFSLNQSAPINCKPERRDRRAGEYENANCGGM